MSAGIRQRLLALRDEKNAAFVAKLISNIPPERILGAREGSLNASIMKIFDHHSSH